jgi:ZIP family zinc transporter
MLSALLVLAFLASMLGGLVPAVEGALERLGLERILSFRSGILVAVAVGDVLPEAWSAAPPAAAAAALGALGLGWFLHRGHGHAGHELTHPHVHGDARAHLPATVAALFAHSLVDGLNLGAVAVVGGPALLVVGAATGLHKLADGFTLTSLFHGTRLPRGRVLALLALVSLTTPLGALLGRAGVLKVGPLMAALLLGFAGGSFLYVGAAQMLPRLRARGLGPALIFAAGFAAMMLLRAASGS